MRHLINTIEQFLAIIPTLKAYVAQQGARLALDVETYGPDKEEVPKATRNADGTLNGYIRTIQLGFDPCNPKFAIRDTQFIIDVTKIPERVLITALKPILESATILGQNLKYEWQFFFVQYGIRLRRMVDTMLFSQILFAGDKVHHGLGDLYGRFLEPGWFFNETGKSFEGYKQFKKDLQTIDWEEGDEFSEEQLTYAADDVKLPFYVLEALFEEIDKWRRSFESGFSTERGIVPTLKLECSLIPVFALMELRGIKLDVKYHHEVVIDYLISKRDEASRMLGFTRVVSVKKSNGLRGKQRIVWYEDVEQALNLRSWQQLKPKINALLHEHLGEDVEIDSTAEDDIRDIVNRYSQPDLDNPERPVLPEEIREKFLWILQFKKASSLLSKFGDKMIKLACKSCAEVYNPFCRGRHYLHPSWFQIGTDELAVDSGRSSCRNPNIMQQPSRGELFVSQRNQSGQRVDGISVMKFFRRSFISEDGWIFVDADYTQEEPRLAAEYCNESSLIDAYKTQGKSTDIHGIVGQKLMKLKEQPKKGDFNRDYIGKTAGLSLIYGISFRALREFMYSKTDGKVIWTEDQAKEAYDNFFDGFPNIRRKMDEVAAEVKQRAEDAGFSLAPFKRGRRPFAVAHTMLGRHRRFCLKSEQMRLPDHELSRAFRPVKIDRETKMPVLDKEGKPVLTMWNAFRERMSAAARESFNHVIQGTSADILKFALLEMQEEFDKAGFDWQEGIVAVIHDEVLGHFKQEHAEQAAKIIETAMINAGQRFLKRVPVEIDLHCGKDWASAKG